MPARKKSPLPAAELRARLALHKIFLRLIAAELLPDNPNPTLPQIMRAARRAARAALKPAPTRGGIVYRPRR